MSFEWSDIFRLSDKKYAAAATYSVFEDLVDDCRRDSMCDEQGNIHWEDVNLQDDRQVKGRRRRHSKICTLWSYDWASLTDFIYMGDSALTRHASRVDTVYSYTRSALALTLTTDYHDNDEQVHYALLVNT